MRNMTVSFNIDLDDPEQVVAAMKVLESFGSEGTAERKPKKKAVEKEEEEEETEESGITIEELRELTKEKATDSTLRPKIKAKLKELGAAAVSDLEEKHYSVYKKFIEKLK